MRQLTGSIIGGFLPEKICQTRLAVDLTVSMSVPVLGNDGLRIFHCWGTMDQGFSLRYKMSLLRVVQMLSLSHPSFSDYVQSPWDSPDHHPTEYTNNSVATTPSVCQRDSCQAAIQVGDPRFYVSEHGHPERPGRYICGPCMQHYMNKPVTTARIQRQPIGTVQGVYFILSLPMEFSLLSGLQYHQL